MQRRPRQEFATGARTLRGGKNHYTAKTLCGNWVEAQYDPEFESLARESKYDAKYESTSAVDAKSGIGIVPPQFGAGMEQYEREARDKAGQTTYKVSDWESVTASTIHLDASKGPTEFVAAKHTVGGLGVQEGEDYRARWTSEGPGLRDQRFTTCNDYAAGFHPSEFRRKPTRAIIGVPNGVTKLRACLVKTHGVDTAYQLKRAFADALAREASVDKQELLDGLVRFLGGLKITSGAPVSAETQLGLAVGELESVVRFFDRAEAGLVSCREFVETVIGPIPENRRALVRDTFGRLVKCAGQSGGTLGGAAGVFAQFYCGRQRAHWGAPGMVSRDSGSLTEAAFVEFYRGVSCAVVGDDDFAQQLAADWTGIADPLKTTSPYERVKKVRVTTKSGEVFEEMIVCDTAAASDPKALRTIYLAKGISVASVRFLTM